MRIPGCTWSPSSILGLPPIQRVMREWLNSPRLVIGLFPDWFAPPQVNVDRRKRRQITRAARVYRQMLGIEDEPHRYDVVTVVIGNTATPQLELLRNFWSEKNLRHG